MKCQSRILFIKEKENQLDRCFRSEEQKRGQERVDFELNEVKKIGYESFLTERFKVSTYSEIKGYFRPSSLNQCEKTGGLAG